MTKNIKASFSTFCIGLTSALFVCQADATDFHLYYMGGQSNMEGYGFNKDLPEQYKPTLPNVMIFNGHPASDHDLSAGLGVWSPLSPGHGTGFQSDGIINKLSDRFGPELSFAHTLIQQNPKQPIAIIKYSRGGSALYPGGSGYGTWNPEFDGNNQYDNALRAIRHAHQHADIDGDGTIDRLVPKGIIWMQGEADAYFSKESAVSYEVNLTNMMNLLRASLRMDDLPVVIGKIFGGVNQEDGKDVMPYMSRVQQAQRDYVAKDACAAFVDVTDQYQFPSDDQWHFDSNSYVVLGQAFANAALELSETCKQ